MYFCRFFLYHLFCSKCIFFARRWKNLSVTVDCKRSSASGDCFLFYYW